MAFTATLTIIVAIVKRTLSCLGRMRRSSAYIGQGANVYLKQFNGGRSD